MDLPGIESLDVNDKKVIVRADLDLDSSKVEKDLRVQSLGKTLDFIKEKGGEIILLGHRGRPGGKVDESLSLKPLQAYFDKWGAKVEENVRFDPGEESNDPEFAKKLSELGDVFVNEAFASSHREHASVVGIPKLLPSAFGFRFLEEVKNLTKVFESPERPIVFLLNGVKEDKLKFVKPLESLADKILIGGRLPDYLGDEQLVSVRLRKPDEKVIVGNLIMDKEDITLNTIELFENEIAKAKTVVLSGPLGKYEEEGHRIGTEKIIKKIAEGSSFNVAGGGDTEEALIMFDALDKFDWVSVGGGAMLTFLTTKTLPAIEAL